MKKYILGFDLLRIILMLFIVIGHLFAHTPFNSPFEFLGFKWIFSWLIQSFTVCAVNCFILMTGFLMINKNFKTQRILKLWGRVYFYSVLLFIIFIIIDPNNLSFYNIKLSIFPVFNSTYWFFTCYVVLLLFMPFINILITRLKTKQLVLLNLIIICLFFILPIFAVFFKELDSTHGYSIIQFISLYIIGGTIKKLHISFKKWKLVISLITTILTIFVSKIVLELIVNHYSLSLGTSLFYRNNTIFVLVEAIILLLLFKDTLVIENKNNIMQKISNAIFSVYIIHEYPLMRTLLWNSRLADIIVKTSNLKFVVFCLTYPLIIFCFCTLLDMIRQVVSKLIYLKISKASIYCKYVDRCESVNSIFNECVDNEQN